MSFINFQQCMHDDGGEMLSWHYLFPLRALRNVTALNTQCVAVSPICYKSKKLKAAVSPPFQVHRIRFTTHHSLTDQEVIGQHSSNKASGDKAKGHRAHGQRFQPVVIMVKVPFCGHDPAVHQCSTYHNTQILLECTHHGRAVSHANPGQ